MMLCGDGITLLIAIQLIIKIEVVKDVEKIVKYCNENEPMKGSFLITIFKLIHC